ncbi:hypothetical protein SAMN06298216_1915 [Spirosomataceae bacterium TFI 002]|nr:hypothetical protein SAMN06298216_1915 [Spirosomataceae bacterium TFI 002]
MKKGIVLLFALLVGFSTMAQKSTKQEATIVSLKQTTGQFEQKKLTLKPGKYVFEIENAGVGKDVGFWLRTTTSDQPLTNSDKAGLIKTDTKSKTGVVELVAGEYYYSCPLNPTPNYKITVK